MIGLVVPCWRRLVTSRQLIEIVRLSDLAGGDVMKMSRVHTAREAEDAIQSLSGVSLIYDGDTRSSERLDQQVS